MGKTTRWIRSLFRQKKTSSSPTTKHSQKHVFSENTSSYPDSFDHANKHAIAVAAATAAVAEAALAAAHAAAEVVRLTAGGGGGGGSRVFNDGDRRRVAAVVKIQAAFRAYLARRALRALKGLVKLQALVRGRIVRNQSADMLRRMQAMARVQARACASRASLSASPHSSSRSSNSHTHHTHKSTHAKGSFINERLKGQNWLESWMDNTSWSSKQCRPDDERIDKILEVDTWKSSLNPSPCNKSPHDPYSTPTKPWNPNTRHAAREMLPLGSMIHREAEKTISTADNTPRVRSSGSRPRSSHKRSPFSEYSRSVFGEYTSYPSYMANTESSRAKLRSHSAPRQRVEFEKSGSTRLLWDYSDSVSERGFRS